MQALIVHFFIIFAFYILSAYATTDILRLLKGSTLPVNSAHCYCPNCNSKIALKDQIPILSYFLNHGKCRVCGCKIPPNDLFALYEAVKCIFLFRHGKIEKEFGKNFLRSLLNNLLLFLFLAFPFALLTL